MGEEWKWEEEWVRVEEEDLVRDLKMAEVKEEEEGEDNENYYCL
jgi:hypothetical protein